MSSTGAKPDPEHASDLKGGFDDEGSVLSAALNVRDGRDLSSTASNTIDEDEVADVVPPDKIDIEGTAILDIPEGCILFSQ